MNTGKGSIVLLTFIAVATLLVAVVGATFAYFSATMGSESGTTIEVTSGTLSVEYDGNSLLNGSNAQPGTPLASKSFTITGVITGSTNLNYEASLEIKNNTFSDGALVYTITSKNTSNNGTPIVTSESVQIPSGKSVISLGKGTFAGPTTKGATHTYIVTINPVQTSDGNVEMGKVFEAQLSVKQSTK